MKTQNLIIGVLTIAVVTLSILLFRAQNCKDKNSPNAACSFSSSDSCCVHITSRLDDIYIEGTACQDSTECGRDFKEDSIGYIRRLIKDAKARNLYNQIYGYQIDVMHIKEMYESIKEFDKKKIEDSLGNVLTVAGVRFYEAVSERYINGENRRKADLVMIPYLSSGDDVFKVDDRPIKAIFKMYAHFRPCPRLCGPKEKYIYED